MNKFIKGLLAIISWKYIFTVKLLFAYMTYIKTIGLENFRLFKDKTVFNLAPITILTGINSSGKSSLIKALQLLGGVIKRNGNLESLDFIDGIHNLGHYGLTLNRDSGKTEMAFTFDFPLDNFKENVFIDLIYDSYTTESESAEIRKLKIYTKTGFSILEAWMEYGYKIKYYYKFDLEELVHRFFKLYDKIYFENQDIFEGNYGTEKYDELIKNWDKIEIENLNDDIFKWFYQYKNGTMLFDKDKWDNQNTIIINPHLLSDANKKAIESLLSDGKNGEYYIEDSFFNKSLIDGIKDLGEFLDSIKSLDSSEDIKVSSLTKFIFSNFFKKAIFGGISSLQSRISEIESLSSIRANSERLYFNNSNIVIFNQLLMDFSRLNISKDGKTHKFIKKALNSYNIGDDIIIKRHQGLASEIFIENNGKLILLADMGFGFTQLVPIIMKIALIAEHSMNDDPLFSFSANIFLLEEPESNLHPSYQSKLAELIIEAASLFNIQFIIETHSEYLIRNLQYLTATKKIKSRDTKIYYFHQPGSEDFKKSPFRVIDIEEDGRLSNEFGEGFFDEIPRLLAHLYNTNFN